MGVDNIIIKQASLQDVQVLQAISRETFFETFASTNSEADMKKYLDENMSEERLAAEMNTPGSSFYLAWVDGNAIGYLKVNMDAAQTDVHDAAALEIERVYVQAIYHGKRVGQLLYEVAVAIARTANKSYIWLGVWEHNLRAVSFYKKNGFVQFGEHPFILGDDVQTDIMMKKVLE